MQCETLSKFNFFSGLLSVGVEFGHIYVHFTPHGEINLPPPEIVARNIRLECVPSKGEMNCGTSDQISMVGISPLQEFIRYY